jgi:sulfatase-like protein
MLAELTALWGFAFVQPVLDVFGRSPEQLVFRRADATTVVVFAVALTVVPIAVLWLIEQLGGLAHRVVGQVLHVAFVAGLLGVIALRVLKRGVGLTGPVLAVLTVALAGGATYLFVRAAVVRQWARYASLATVAFLLLFLFGSPATDIVRGDAVTASGSTVGEPASVVMLVFDELPLESLVDEDGSIDASLYPNFAELAATSNWFRNATAVSPSTWHAVPALATGMYPIKSAPLARDHPDSIFTLLGGSYQMDVTESITRLCPTNVCDAPEVDRAQSLRRLGDDVRDVVRSQLALHETTADPVAGLVERPRGDGFADFGRDQPERYSGFLSRIRADEPPTLHYLHILLPHVPWRYLPSGLQYEYPDRDPGKVDDDWIDQAWPPDLGRQRHLLQLRYVDRLVGDLLDRLRATGTFDDSLLVVTADHGISFRPGQPVRGLESDEFVEPIHPDVMWVPMFVKSPGQRAGETLDTNVETVDLVPTIADVLDVEMPWDPDGRSAFSDRPRGSMKTFFQSKVNPFGVDVGPRVQVEAEDGWQALRGRTVDTFLGPPAEAGTEGAGLRSWRVGPRPELVDTPVDALGRGDSTGVTASIDGGEGLGTVARSSGRLPVLLTGALAGAPPGAQTVVWSLDGRIAAVTPTFVEGDQAHAVAVMLPAPMVRDGANHLELFLLRPDDRLEPIPLG